VPSFWLVLIIVIGVVVVINLVLLIPGVREFLRTRHWPGMRG